MPSWQSQEKLTSETIDFPAAPSVLICCSGFELLILVGNCPPFTSITAELKLTPRYFQLNAQLVKPFFPATILVQVVFLRCTLYTRQDKSWQFSKIKQIESGWHASFSYSMLTISACTRNLSLNLYRILSS